MIAYLSGPIENALNDGADWRIEMTKWLKENLTHNVFDPVKETKSILKNMSKNSFRSMKLNNPKDYRLLMREIIELDLNAVINKTDYLIVNWNENVLKGGGTHGEVTIAYYFNKPIYIVNTIPLNRMSSWIFGCADKIFVDFNDLKKFLLQFNKNKTK